MSQCYRYLPVYLLHKRERPAFLGLLEYNKHHLPYLFLTTNLPVPDFFAFHLQNNDHFTELTADVFQNATFEEVYIVNTNIYNVSEYALRKSEHRLRHFIIEMGEITDGAYPFNNLDYYSNLTEVFLQFQNGITFIPLLTSETLARVGFAFCSIDKITPGKSIDNITLGKSTDNITPGKSIDNIAPDKDRYHSIDNR